MKSNLKKKTNGMWLVCLIKAGRENRNGAKTKCKTPESNNRKGRKKGEPTPSREGKIPESHRRQLGNQHLKKMGPIVSGGCCEAPGGGGKGVRGVFPLHRGR